MFFCSKCNQRCEVMIKQRNKMMTENRSACCAAPVMRYVGQ